MNDDELKDFCDWVMNDPLVQEHNRKSIQRWKDDPGFVTIVEVNRFENLYVWMGGPVARIPQATYMELYEAREQGMLPFDFCTLCVVNGGLGPDHIISKIEV